MKTVEELQAENTKLSEKLATAEASAQKLSEVTAERDTLKTKLSEVESEIAKLKTDKEEADKKAALAEKENQFNKLLSEGKAIPAQKEAWMAGDVVKFAELAGKANLSESGNGGSGKKFEGDVQDEIKKLADAKMKADEDLDFAGAVKLVLSENKELAEEYNKLGH